MSAADTNLLSGIVEHRNDHEREGFIVIKLSGEPYANALVQCVATNYNRITGRERPTEDDLRSRIGQKVTLVRGGENLLGSSVLNAMEGRLFEGSSGGLAILPKGSRKNGYRVEPKKVVDLLDGYATAQAQELVAEVRAHYPSELRNLTQERLEELPGENQGDEMLSLALLGEWNLPGERAVDCVWMIGEYWPEDDICDRSVLLIRPQHGTSEPGSVYGQQLVRSQALAEIVGFDPISFKDAIDLCFIDFDEACKAVFDRAAVVAA